MLVLSLTTLEIRINARRSGLVMKYLKQQPIPGPACRENKLAGDLYIPWNNHETHPGEI